MADGDGAGGPGGPDSSTTSDGYDELADRADDLDGWESPWTGENPLQRLHAWPTAASLLPDVEGKRVLDAGCGVGDVAARLAEAGAGVVGVDASERAVERARDRLGEAADVWQADLADGLPGLDADAVDVVLCNLVLDHVENWGPVMAAFRRVLRPSGALVFTCVHPVQYYETYDAVTDYHEVTPVEVAWPGAPVTSYHRPMAEVVSPLPRVGFRLDEIVEPEPPAEYVERTPDEWDLDSRPQLLGVRAVPDER